MPPENPDLTRRALLAAGAALGLTAATPVGAAPPATAPPPPRRATEPPLPVRIEPPVRYACCRCGGTNVTLDAWAEWDADVQAWVMASVYDHAYCHDCDDETRLDEIAFDPAAETD